MKLLLKGPKPTLLQKMIKLYLRYSWRLIVFLLVQHEKIAEVGVSQHPCWAGGIDEEGGVTSQPCQTCDPLNDEAISAYRLLKEI